MSSIHSMGKTALLVDLNNFATFPTLAVGILISALRQAGHTVQLLVPLEYDVPATERERVESRLDHWMRRVHLSTWPPTREMRNTARALWYWWHQRPHPIVLKEVARAIKSKPDVVLLSAYLQHHPTVVEIGKLTRAAGIPLLLGGPAFNLEGVAEAWRQVPGLTAIFGGEADLVISDLVEAVARKEDLLNFQGVTLPDGTRSAQLAPFRDLDSSPIPDFGDFPWKRYPVRIVPIMATRGCQWGKCTFCSDVVSANGRTFRQRSLENVLHEMQEQSRRHATSNFLFLDLKLNSNPALFRGIVERVQVSVPGAQWIGTVHVDTRADNGLSLSDLHAASASGMRRISFGLESGSQRLLDSMSKGSSVETNSMFIRHASEAGISVRCTMFKGYPGETPEDLEQTAKFLRDHRQYIDRIRFNEFSVPENTPIWKRIHAGGEKGIEVRNIQSKLGRTDYVNRLSESGEYRRAKAKVLHAVYAINRRAIKPDAQMFDGMM
jgi:anaerobic magnesium-protoporphyrin IX monomethyl ester cyclase